MVNLAVLGYWLDLIILEVFSNLSDSRIPCDLQRSYVLPVIEKQEPKALLSI